jgi:hypothetical protein
MPSPKPPTPPSPQESASAALQAQLGGDVYHTLNAPLEGYADLYMQSLLGPARAQLQSGLAAQTALQGARAQQAVQAETDPMAYAIRQMNLKAASSRLGQLYGMDPSAFGYKAPSAFATPTSAQLPPMSSIEALTGAISRNMVPVSLGKGGDINIGTPQGGGTIPASVLPVSGGAGAVPSYLGLS